MGRLQCRRVDRYGAAAAAVQIRVLRHALCPGAHRLRRLLQQVGGRRPATLALPLGAISHLLLVLLLLLRGRRQGAPLNLGSRLLLLVLVRGGSGGRRTLLLQRRRRRRVCVSSHGGGDVLTAGTSASLAGQGDGQTSQLPAGFGR